MDVARGDEMVALMLPTLLMVVVFNEGVAEGFAVLVVEGILVALVPTATFTQNK